MVPAEAMLDAAAHYLQAAGFDPSQVIELRLLDGDEGVADSPQGTGAAR
jgi:glutamate formiminotransferase